jgi:hypothetical protein
VNCIQQDKIRRAVEGDPYVEVWEFLLSTGFVPADEQFPVAESKWPNFIAIVNRFSKRFNSGEVIGPCTDVRIGWYPNRLILNFGPVDIFLDLGEFEILELRGDEVRKMKLLWLEHVKKVYWTLYVPEMQRILTMAAAL